MGVYADIITALKTELDSVANIGKTHNHQRYVADWSGYLDSFTQTVNGQNQVRGWMLMPDESNAIVGTWDEQNRINRTYNVLIAGILGVKDSDNTEATFMALCESVVDEIDALDTLTGVTGVTVGAIGPCVLRKVEIRQFGSVLCHYGEILVPVETTKAI